VSDAEQSGDSFTNGARYAMAGLKLITKPGIRRFVMIPLCINVIVFIAGFTLIGWSIDYAMDRLLPNWLDWLRWILWPLFALCALAVLFFGFSVVANLVGSPFNGFLAEAVEQHLCGQLDATPFSWRRLLREAWSAVLSELIKLLYFAVWAVPCLVLFLIPGVNAVAAPIWFLFGAWMLAIEYVDCPLGNHGKPFPEVKHRLRPRRKLALGFGSAMMGLTMVPGLNFIAMPVGVAGATALYVDRIRETGALET
jgi:CysZ protein